MHGATWPLIPAKSSFNLQITPLLYAFLATFAINLLVNKISMDPCRDFALGAMVKFQSANSNIQHCKPYLKFLICKV
jgi:hypothetical protein